MKLRYQLAALSLTFLAIPWAGCEFLKSNEKTLSLLQEQSLKATGEAIAHQPVNPVQSLIQIPQMALQFVIDATLQRSRGWMLGGTQTRGIEF